MRNHSRQLNGFVLFTAVLLVMVINPGASPASRFHVKSSGTRVAGASNAGDWSDANCYPTLSLAALAASGGDSLLLDRETHVLDEAVSLTRFLGNRDLDANSGSTGIAVSATGRLVTDGSFPHLVVRGLSFVGDGANSDHAAVEITNTLGLLTHAFIHNCTFSGLEGSDLNSPLAGSGSALRADGDGAGAYLEMRDCRFQNNRARGGGGAVFIGDNYSVYMADSEFRNNLADNGRQIWDGRGGAIYVKSNNFMSDLTMVDCLVTANAAKGPGGAMFIEEGSLALFGTDITDSQSALAGSTQWSAGAGIFMRGMATHAQTMRFEMWDCVVQNNRGDLSAGTMAGDGGGVLVKGISGQMVDVHVADCVFEDNYNAQGAGLYIGRFTTGEVERCSFRNNTALYNGGGSYKGGAFAENLGETVVYNYCEFVGNRAGFHADGTEAEVDSRGGGFCTHLYPRAFFYNCTFLENRVGSFAGLSDAVYMWRDGGQFDDDLKRLRLINCLFYGTTAQDIQINNLESAFQLVTHCAFEEGQFATPGVTPEATVTLTGSPCVSLTDVALVEGAVCIDAALEVGLEEDLVGDLVPQGAGPDIGAREYPQAASPVTTSPEIPLAGLHSAKVYPNPFNPQTRISFSLDQDRPVDIAIFDIRGALVHQLFRGHLTAGDHGFNWDGRDSRGRSVASGTYHAVIRGNGQQLAVRMALVR